MRQVPNLAQPLAPVNYTVAQACHIGNFGKTTAFAMIRSGQLKAVHLGRKVLIPAAALEEFLANLPQAG